MMAKLGILSWVCRLMGLVEGGVVDPEMIILEQGEFLLVEMEPVGNHRKKGVLEKLNF